MSPLSFLSAFALPSFSSVNSYLPTLSLPENIQQKLVSFVLRRTLGRFVQHEGLLGDKVETQVATGRIAFGRLELDPSVRLRTPLSCPLWSELITQAAVQAINTFLPLSLPLTFLHGHIESADIQLPFPNLLSAPLSINLEEIHLTLGLREPFDDGDGEQSVNLGRSVLEVTEEFVAGSLSPREMQDLSASIACRSGTEENQNAEESIYQTPGGFPVPDSGSLTAAPPSTSILASAIENVLSRLQVQVKRVIVTLKLPSEPAYTENVEESDISSTASVSAAVAQAIEIRLERIAYGFDGNNEDLGVRQLKIADVGIWMVTKSSKRIDNSEESLDSVAPGSAGGPRKALRLSPSATLAQSTSMYESAIGSTLTSSGLEHELDPFGSSRGSSSESDDGIQQEDLETQSHCLCSLGQSGLKLILREPGDTLVPTMVDLEVGYVRAAVSDDDVGALATLASAWISRTPFSSEIETVKPSPDLNKTTDVKWTVASIQVMVFSASEGQQGLILGDGDDAEWMLPRQMGLELFLGGLKGLISTDTSRINMDDLQLLWHRAGEETTPANPATLVSLFPKVQDNASSTQNLGNDLPGQPAKHRSTYRSDRPAGATSSALPKSLAVSMGRGSGKRCPG